MLKVLIKRSDAAGLMVTLGNPKIMVFYLALLPTFVDLGHVGVAAWAELTGTMLLVLVLVLVLVLALALVPVPVRASVDIGWALLANRARHFLKRRRAVKITNRAGATVMAGAAMVIASR